MAREQDSEHRVHRSREKKIGGGRNYLARIALDLVEARIWEEQHLHARENGECQYRYTITQRQEGETSMRSRSRKKIKYPQTSLDDSSHA